MVPATGCRSIRIWKTHRVINECLSAFGKPQTGKRILSGHAEPHLSRNYSDQLRQPPCLRSELLCNVVEPVQDGMTKVTVVGAGTVGIACVNSLLFQKISNHVTLLDAFPKRLRGEGMDFSHGLIFLDDPQFEYDTDFCASSNSKVVIITIGVRQMKNESRLELVHRNAEIIKTIIVPLAEYSPKAVFIIVTNPVDIMSWLAWKVSGLPINRVIGTGTHLDTARFRYMIANRLGVASHSIHGYIVGEHGDSQVPLWSSVSAGGVTFRDILPNIGMTTDEEKWYEIARDVMSAGPTVRCLKGYSNTAVGLTVADITKAILLNNQTIKCVSTLVQGHYDVCEELFLSLPCTIGERGISSVVRVRMTEHERKMFKTSAAQVYSVQKDMKL
ncbi:L-lactate dehydrogenase A chain-like [Copidosoma floridanum]|uniref:L-lactate dehydrogenase A chain-like n=1 Tax=Copidosoma floridanum TaxID=29053 RepID=UPI0006C9C906|nr:L-lactate dehydrogenase A chain-like [Copidosoma floridanum]